MINKLIHTITWIGFCLFTFSGLAQTISGQITDQQTGERFGEPLRTLREFRKVDDGYAGGIAFGEYLSVDGQGTLAVGDVLTI